MGRTAVRRDCTRVGTTSQWAWAFGSVLKSTTSDDGEGGNSNLSIEMVISDLDLRSLAKSVGTVSGRYQNTCMARRHDGWFSSDARPEVPLRTKSLRERPLFC